MKIPFAEHNNMVEAFVESGQQTSPWQRCPAPDCAEMFAIPGLAIHVAFHVLGDTRMRGLKPELEQFAMDAGRSPERILHAHPPDQYTQLRINLLWPFPSP